VNSISCMVKILKAQIKLFNINNSALHSYITHHLPMITINYLTEDVAFNSFSLGEYMHNGNVHPIEFCPYLSPSWSSSRIQHPLSPTA
jgi:hypothetical protein